MQQFKKDMYVLTTYGIGKIIDVYIITTDDNYLWMVDYITDTKIEVAAFSNKSIKLKNVPTCKYWKATDKDIDLINAVWNNLDEVLCYVLEDRNIIRGASSLYKSHKFIDCDYDKKILEEKYKKYKEERNYE